MISLVIPMYNSKDTIVRALDSVKNQTMIDMIAEIIIINDGSTDDSLQIVKKYATENPNLNIRLINKKNGGVSSARNAGLKVVNSEWVALLDSDDEWLPSKIEKQLNAIKEYPDLDFVGGNDNDREMRILFKKINRIYKANIIDLCLKCFPATSTVLFKKKIIEDIGFFDETQRYGEDMNYFNKICLNYNYYHIPTQLEIYSRDTTRKTHKGLSSNLKGMHKGNIKNINELRDQKHISMKFYLFLRVFYQIKYIRRIVLKFI